LSEAFIKRAKILRTAYIKNSPPKRGLYPGAETPDQPDEVVVVDAGDVVECVGWCVVCLSNWLILFENYEFAMHRLLPDLK
jgi:hypothetical protein